MLWKRKEATGNDTDALTPKYSTAQFRTATFQRFPRLMVATISRLLQCTIINTHYYQPYKIATTKLQINNIFTNILFYFILVYFKIK